MKYLYLVILLLAFAANLAASNVVVSLNYSSATFNVGEQITLIATRNAKPTQEHWIFVGNGSASGNGDKFTITGLEIGKREIEYLGYYADTTVILSCKFEVIDTLDLSFTHSIEYKEGFTDLTILSKFVGYNPISQYKLTSDKQSKYSIIDSSTNKVVYRIEESDNWHFNLSLKFPNNIIPKTKSQDFLIPINKIKNTENNLTEIHYTSSIFPFHDLLFYQKFGRSYRSFQPRNYPYYVFENYYYFDIYDITNYFSQEPIYSNRKYTTSYSSEDSYLKFGSRILFQDKYSQLSVLNLFDNYSTSKFIILNNLNFKAVTLDTFNCFGIITPKEIQINKIENGYFVNCLTTPDYYTGKNVLYLFYLDKSSKSFTMAKDFDQNLYMNSLISNNGTANRMISFNSNLNLYTLDGLMKITDTLLTIPYNKFYSKSINKHYAYGIIEADNKTRLVAINLIDNQYKNYELDSSIKYHQICQLRNSVNCLVGLRNDTLIIQAFKNNDFNLREFAIPVKEAYQIVDLSAEGELHFNYSTEKPSASYFKTKGFALIYKSLETIDPLVDSIPEFYVTLDSNIASLVQTIDYSTAKIKFKDGQDLSNTYLKVYSESGQEILSYDLSKDQKEQQIQTDKLHIGTYFVRLLRNGEEYNLGKFIIVR